MAEMTKHLKHVLFGVLLVSTFSGCLEGPVSAEALGIFNVEYVIDPVALH